MVPDQSHYLSAKEAPHNIDLLRVSEEYFVCLKRECQSDGRNPRSPTFHAETASTTAPGHPQLCDIELKFKAEFD